MSRGKARGLGVAIVFVLLVALPSGPPAAGDDHDGETTTEVSDSAFEVGSIENDVQPGQAGSGTTSSNPSPPPASQVGVITGGCLGVPASCVNEPAAAASAALLIGRAFRRVPLPASGLVIQPPGGKTLVNFDTIFSTEAEPFQRTLRLLGHEVRLKIWASSFSWHFGDGSEPLSTTEAGRKYQRGLPMDSYITHQYKDADVTVRPRVNTTYSAEYNVDGGPFQPVIGTVTINGEPTTLRVVEGRPVLTGTR